MDGGLNKKNSNDLNQLVKAEFSSVCIDRKFFDTIQYNSAIFLPDFYINIATYWI